MGLAVWDMWCVPHFVFNSRTGCEKYAHKTAETWEQAGSFCLRLQTARVQHEGALATFHILGKWRPQIKFSGTTQSRGVLSTGTYPLFSLKSLVLQSYITVLLVFDFIAVSRSTWTPGTSMANSTPSKMPVWATGETSMMVTGACPTVIVQSTKGNMVRHIFQKKESTLCLWNLLESMSALPHGSGPLLPGMRLMFWSQERPGIEMVLL